MRPNKSPRILVTILWIFFIVLSLRAQDSQKEQVVADTLQKAEPELIPPMEITNRLPQSAAALRDIESAIISEENIDVLKAELDSFILGFNLFLQEYALRDTSLMERRSLESDLYQWNQWKTEITSIKQRMNDAVIALEAQKQSLDDLTNVWELSRVNYTPETVPANVREFVQSFITSASETRESLNEKTRTLLSYLEEVTQQEILIDDQIRMISKEMEVFDSTILLEKGEWIVKLLLNTRDNQKLLGEISGNIKLNLQPAWNYILRHTHLFMFSILIFAILYLLLYLFRKNYKVTIAGLSKIQLERIQYIVRRPLLTAMYLTLVSYFLYLPDPPAAMKQIIFLALLIPILLLLPGILRHKLDQSIYFLGALVLVLDASDLIFYPFLLDRIIEIAIACILIIGIIRIIRQKKLTGLFEKKMIERFINFFSMASVILLTISMVSNIVGYYALGEFFIESVVWSLYAITLFLVGYVVFIGLLYVVIHLKPLQDTMVFQKYSEQITQWFFKLAFTVTVFSWIYIILYIFRIHDQCVSLIVSIWNLGFEVGKFNFSLGSLITFFITLWIAVLLSRVIQTVLEEDVLSRFKLERGLPKTISQMAKYGLITIGILIAFAAAGIELSNLAILLGALGVGIGFGLQDVINNFISGLILLFERPVQIGDAVKVGDLEGIVVRIGLRSSIIQTFDHAEVIVPNGHLISNEVINWTLSNTMRRLEIEVGVAYGSDIEKVMEVLKECATSHEQVLDDPAPYVWFKGYGESSVDFRLLFFYPQFEGGMTVRSEVAKAIDKAFRKHGITIPFPQRDLYIKEHRLNEQDSLKKRT